MIKNVEKKPSSKKSGYGRIKITCPNCGYINLKQQRSSHNKHRCFRCHQYI